MHDVDKLRLTSLTLQANDKQQIVGVKCQLSNGLESSLFKSLMSDNDESLVTQTLDFNDENNKIRTIEAQDDGMSQVFNLVFKDESGAELASFIPGGEPKPDLSFQTRSIGKSFCVVGIYGIKDDARHITSLGFITKEV